MDLSGKLREESFQRNQVRTIKDFSCEDRYVMRANRIERNSLGAEGVGGGGGRRGRRRRGAQRKAGRRGGGCECPCHPHAAGRMNSGIINSRIQPGCGVYCAGRTRNFACFWTILGSLGSLATGSESESLVDSSHRHCPLIPTYQIDVVLLFSLSRFRSSFRLGFT